MSETKDRFAYLRRKHAATQDNPTQVVQVTMQVDPQPGRRCLSGELPEENRSFDVSELLDDLIRQEMRGPWTRTTGVYHPSSLSPGSCKRALYYDRTAMPPRPQHSGSLQAIFDEGHGTHHIIQSRIKRGHAGFEEECHINIESLKISGSTDGVFQNEDWILEIKTIGDAGFSSLVRPKTEHVWQMHPYMFARDIPRAQLLYVNRNTGAKRSFKVYFDVKVWDQIKLLIAEIERHVERQEPPEPIDDAYQCRGCKFKYVCKP